MKTSYGMPALLAGLLFSGAVQASIVDHGDYLTDTATGLEWLDVTQTVNMSFDQVTAQLGSGGSLEGWRYASGSEFLTLTSDYTGTSLTSLTTKYDLPTLTDGLIALLGSTSDVYYLQNYGQTYDQYNSISGYSFHETSGLLSDATADGTNQYLATLRDLDLASNNQPLEDSILAHFTNYRIDHGFNNIGLGSYLVRETATVFAATAVPEPTSNALFGIALFGMVALRRKSRKA